MPSRGRGGKQRSDDRTQAPLPGDCTNEEDPRMTADKTSILAEIAELLRGITDSLLPGEDITMETKLREDLELQSLGIANLNGRIQARHGYQANLVPFFAAREAGPYADLRVGEIVDYLAGVLDGDGTPPAAGEPVLGTLAARNGEARAAAARAAVTQSAAGMPVVPLPPGPCSVIINSGRCGSTLLSRLIAQEPETLSVSESMGHLRNRLIREPYAEATGADYWALLSEPGLGGRLMLRLGIIPAEFCYPDSGRYAADKLTIPPILLITLPALSADPDRLFDQLAELVPDFPTQTIGQHHKMMLDLLANLTGRRRWVERTGSSSLIAEPVLASFPDAKIVYLTRNIADTALSMSRHPAFQISVARHRFHALYGTDPYLLSWSGSRPEQTSLPDAADLPEEMRRLLPDQITPEALQEMSRDMVFFEGMVAHMHGTAEQALADMKPRHLHRIRYEDLLAEPLDELTRLGEFLGFADPSGWAARAASQVASQRPRSVQPV
jgi:putative sulfotransferase